MSRSMMQVMEVTFGKRDLCEWSFSGFVKARYGCRLGRDIGASRVSRFMQ
jgi:hypothetical protein